jgi:H+/Cl- antiporter ClcA
LSESQLRNSFSEQLHLLFELGRWIPVAALVGLMAGSASALLLISLNYATYLRERHTWLILLLAPAGWLIGLLYQQVGSRVEGGNNLILEETHDPTSTIPARLTPLVLVGTVVTHIFGGSAGREGTHSTDGRHQRGVWLRLRDTIGGCNLRT